MIRKNIITSVENDGGLLRIHLLKAIIDNGALIATSGRHIMVVTQGQDVNNIISDTSSMLESSGWVGIEADNIGKIETIVAAMRDQ